MEILHGVLNDPGMAGHAFFYFRDPSYPSGDDIAMLKQIGTEVENIVRAVPFSWYVHRDYFNDSHMVNIDVNNELANRLGLTNGAVSQILSGGF